MQVKRPDWTAANPYSLEYVSWSARTGFLVPAKKQGDGIVPIHTLECPKNEVKKISKVIIEEMSSVAESDQHSFSIPLTVDLNTGENWGTLH